MRPNLKASVVFIEMTITELSFVTALAILTFSYHFVSALCSVSHQAVRFQRALNNVNMIHQAQAYLSH